MAFIAMIMHMCVRNLNLNLHFSIVLIYTSVLVIENVCVGCVCVCWFSSIWWERCKVLWSWANRQKYRRHVMRCLVSRPILHYIVPIYQNYMYISTISTSQCLLRLCYWCVKYTYLCICIHIIWTIVVYTNRTGCCIVHLKSWCSIYSTSFVNLIWCSLRRTWCV